MKTLHAGRGIRSKVRSGSNFVVWKASTGARGRGRAGGRRRASHPGPVRRRPDQVVRLREEVVRELEPRQVACSTRCARQRALRRPGRARGVDDQRRRVGPVATGSKRSEASAQRGQLAVDVDRPHALELAVGERPPGRRRRAAPPSRVRVESENDDRAELVDRDVRDRRLGRCGSAIPTRSPAPTPQPAARSRAGSSRRIAHQVTRRVTSRPSVTTIATASRGWRSQTSTPRLTCAGSCQRKLP